MGMDGDQDEQNESQAFLMSAFSAALALMFIIPLAQFNSFYNSFVVLIAVVLSTVGVLIGMLVMQQPFCHYDRNGDCCAGGDCCEQQHRFDRHLSGI